LNDCTNIVCLTLISPMLEFRAWSTFVLLASIYSFWYLSVFYNLRVFIIRLNHWQNFNCFSATWFQDRVCNFYFVKIAKVKTPQVQKPAKFWNSYNFKQVLIKVWLNIKVINSCLKICHQSPVTLKIFLRWKGPITYFLALNK